MSVHGAVPDNVSCETVFLETRISGQIAELYGSGFALFHVKHLVGLVGVRWCFRFYF